MVLFVYAGANGETTARSVYPVRLCFKNASWYLQGFCTEKNAFRTFKVGRMEQVELSGKRLETHCRLPRRWRWPAGKGRAGKGAAVDKRGNGFSGIR